jgi:hypothetical protein
MVTVLRNSSNRSRFFLQNKGLCLLSCFFHYVVERVSVESPNDASFQGGDRSCSGTVVQESQLTETFARLVRFEVGGVGVAGEYLGALEASLFKHIHAVPLVALLDHHLVRLAPYFF